MGRAKDIIVKVIPAKIANDFVKSITILGRLSIIAVYILAVFLMVGYTVL